MKWSRDTNVPTPADALSHDTRLPGGPPSFGLGKISIHLQLVSWHQKLVSYDVFQTLTKLFFVPKSNQNIRKHHEKRELENCCACLVSKTKNQRWQSSTDSVINTFSFKSFTIKPPPVVLLSKCFYYETVTIRKYWILMMDPSSTYKLPQIIYSVIYFCLLSIFILI